MPLNFSRATSLSSLTIDEPVMVPLPLAGPPPTGGEAADGGDGFGGADIPPEGDPAVGAAAAAS